MSKAMRRLFGASLAITLIASLVATLFMSHTQTLESTFATSPMGNERPTDVEIAYEPVSITVGERNIRAWYIQADSPVGAVLVFHGQRESLSNWIVAIERLHNANFSTFIFDYSGFGDSSGKPSVEALREDSKAAHNAFLKRASGLPTYLLGYSLGAGVLLDALQYHEMTSEGIVLASAFSSIRDLAIDEGSMPSAFSFLIPNLYDNVSNAKSVKTPIRVVHSKTDGRFPVWMAEKVAEAAEDSNLTIVQTPGHSDFLASRQDIDDSGDEFWAAVLAGMK
jgi:pimeloyl-ACP methyl ester carboxylesterase